MQKMKKWCIALILSGSVSVVHAETAVESLNELLSGYKNFSAHFEQVTRTDQKITADVSTGSMQISRPGKFRWETKTPFPQTIVSDGEYLWVYDPDLEQATRKPFSAQQSNGAALILNGKVNALAQQFTIERRLDNENEQLFELKPKDEQSSFQKIRLFFTNGVMSELMLQDLLGQQTTILFSDAKLNIAIAENNFDFSPPEGTDVILSDE